MNAARPMSLVEASLADIVTGDARAAAVFDRLGLDYCCRGHQTVQDAAIDSGIPVSDLVDALLALEPLEADRSAAEWTDLGALSRHIVTKYHAYVRQVTPQISTWLDKLAARHGSRHPELISVRETFAALSSELLTHMVKEENLLFPFIETLAATERSGGRLPPGPFGTIVNPIRVMESDHEHAGDLLTRLRHLTGGYEAPADGCTTYRLCYQELARFEADLHRHVHLENNVLFPRAMALESALA